MTIESPRGKVLVVAAHPDDEVQELVVLLQITLLMVMMYILSSLPKVPFPEILTRVRS